MIDTNDNTVTVCMDYIKGRCSREKCKYFHPPAHLQAKIKAAQYQVNQAAAAQAAATAAAMVSRDLSSVLVNGHKTVNSCIWQQAIHLLTFKNFFFFFFAEDMFVQVSQTIHNEVTIQRSEGNSSNGSDCSCPRPNF